MLHPQVGHVWSWKPEIFSETRDPKIPKTIRGTVIHVNEAHRHFTAEAIVFGYAIRESFKF